MVSMTGPVGRATAAASHHDPLRPFGPPPPGWGGALVERAHGRRAQHVCPPSRIPRGAGERLDSNSYTGVWRESKTPPGSALTYRQHSAFLASARNRAELTVCILSRGFPSIPSQRISWHRFWALFGHYLGTERRVAARTKSACRQLVAQSLRLAQKQQRQSRQGDVPARVDHRSGGLIDQWMIRQPPAADQDVRSGRRSS